MNYVSVLCGWCDKEFQQSIRRWNEYEKRQWKHYCSKECSWQAKVTSVSASCSECGDPVTRMRAQVKRSKSGNLFCSRSCATSFRNRLRIGEDHPNYRNGSGSYRDRALKQYGCVCCDCGEQRLFLLAAHHIDGDREGGNGIENLEIVCCNCHVKRHLKLLNEIWVVDWSALTPRHLLPTL
jgi:hypothetical protein